MQKQQQETGCGQVLQLPGAEEAASHRADADRAVQRHHRHARTAVPYCIDAYSIFLFLVVVFNSYVLLLLLFVPVFVLWGQFERF